MAELAAVLIPDLYPVSAVFSPDGARVMTASHEAKDPTTGETRAWATIWAGIEPLESPADPELWRLTRYCPPVELRMDLLGVSQQEAEAQLAACEARVAEAFARAPSRP